MMPKRITTVACRTTWQAEVSIRLVTMAERWIGIRQLPAQVARADVGDEQQSRGAAPHRGREDRRRQDEVVVVAAGEGDEQRHASHGAVVDDEEEQGQQQVEDQDRVAERFDRDAARQRPDLGEPRRRFGRAQRRLGCPRGGRDSTADGIAGPDVADGGDGDVVAPDSALGH